MGGWLERLEWQWLTAWWHGWHSEVRGLAEWGDRWATVSHWGGRGEAVSEGWTETLPCHRLQLWLFIISEAAHHSELQISQSCLCQSTTIRLCVWNSFWHAALINLWTTILFKFFALFWLTFKVFFTEWISCYCYWLLLCQKSFSSSSWFKNCSLQKSFTLT